ncbi:diaminopimelate epimerase [Candidatus Bodocaedibacter vickermanii]|uniref:Diaminopimelate epimerase n=1 Tax=Candidatus Bodocaedibacter vickermanii TaxID=2741701 RepID=A0A7L9RT72_9PROT|nr:Diaminopimelate epimerase [Candidatus Paracaedibacteraceae bacterium 'Lake Konstanz']
MLFHKMHGLGNDFIILKHTKILAPVDVISLCDRHTGIGADQLITYTDDEESVVRFYNQDGTAAEQCGNGIRCLAWLLMTQRKQASIKVQSPTGHHEAWLLDDGQVRITMGQPEFTWDDQPISQQLDLLDLFTDLAHKPDMVAVSMGNPHAVIFTQHPTIEMAETYGPHVEHHRLFPNRTNVHFVHVESQDHITMIPWERGTGITLACGSGACAVHAAALKKGLIDPICDITMPGGTVTLETRDDGVIVLTGPATYVFEGKIA